MSVTRRTNRQTCSSCRRLVAVTRHWIFYRHNDTAGKRCPGSGRKAA